MSLPTIMLDRAFKQGLYFKMQMIALSCIALSACSDPGATSAPIAETHRQSDGTEHNQREHPVQLEIWGEQSALSDAYITKKINKAFKNEKLLMDTTIRVETRSGIVTLTGYANSLAVSEKASDICRHTAGVKKVENLLIIST